MSRFIDAYKTHLAELSLMVMILLVWYKNIQPQVACVDRNDNKGCLGSQTHCYGAFGYIAPGRNSRPTRLPNHALDCANDWKQTYPDPVVPNKQKQRSTHDEDLIIFHTFFKNTVPVYGGTYLEMGAFDGITESNTRFFDECLYWDGVLIEGNPGMYAKLANPDTRSTAHKFNFVPSCHHFSKISFNRFDNTAGHVTKMDPSANVKHIQVHCAPLSVYLKSIGMTQIDFFSLDVEGSEADVLETIDGISFHVVMVEQHNRMCRVNEPCQKRDRVRRIMADKGFRRIDAETLITASDVFINESIVI